MDSVKITVTGVVQGVGFRPFTANLARELGITGTVRNTGGGVEIFAVSDGGTMPEFIRKLTREAPRNAHIAEIEVTETDPCKYESFEILPSEGHAGVVFVPVDLAVCPECAQELNDPADRRYEYPFINCTQCGPRYTIIESLPYDRASTTMDNFEMCEQCQAEYDNPSDRRYHAQPNACEVCGPNVWLGDLKGIAAVQEAARLIDNGEIVAMRGLGGYHLLCDATDNGAVLALREQKKRPTKPLAVMCDNRELLDAPDEVLKELFSSRAPIVIFKWVSHPLSRHINPLSDEIGVMSAYTPLHKLLLKYTRTDFLVATSGNRQDEPIVAGISEAEERLCGFTPHFLHHNRPIKTPLDDSVAAFNGGRITLLRRGRGYAPFPVKLPVNKPVSVFAAGAHLKNCLTVTKGKYAFVSQYLGDLDNKGAIDFYRTTYGQMVSLLNSQPEIAVCDLHDGYWTTEFARTLGIPLYRLQHHHAHMYAVMAEHGLTDNVIAVIMDGTGYGTDGAIWGGEFFSYRKGQIQREAHIEYIPQPAGDASVKHPARMAQSWLMKAGLWGLYWAERMGMSQDIAALNGAMINNNVNTSLTSSAGRLFESIGAMVTGIGTNEYEGHTAIALESLANDDSGVYPYRFEGDSVLMKDVVTAVAEDIQGGVCASTMSARFHNTMAKMICDKCMEISSKCGIQNIVISGGVFQNKRLMETVLLLLDEKGLKSHIPVNVPANDSCISLGQAYYAHKDLELRLSPE